MKKGLAVCLWLALAGVLLFLVFRQANLLSNMGYVGVVAEGFKGSSDGWLTQFDVGYQLFNQRYRPTTVNGVPVFPLQRSVTGLFANEEPAPLDG